MNPTTTADTPPMTRRVPDSLLSWDRLGFRLLVFGSLALAWILQGMVAGQSWQKLMLTRKYVDIEQVREAHPWTKGGWILVTRSGLKIPVGQHYHHVLTKILK